MQFLGVFIEGKSVKLALISQVKNQLTIESLEEFEEMPQSILQNKDLHVVSGLSSEDVVRRDVSLKLTNQSAVVKALPFQLENLLPFSLEETLVHPFFYRQADRTDVVAFATTRLALKKHLVALEEKKIAPDQVSCVPIALAQFARLLFTENALSWVYKNTALALEGNKIIFSQSLEDRNRLETFLKNKYSHHFLLPQQLPNFQGYSSDQLLDFAIPIGFALDGLSKTPCQFRQNDFTSLKKKQQTRLMKLGTWITCLSLTLVVGSVGEWILHRKEKALKERIGLHFATSGSLESQVTAWQKKLMEEGQEFPLLPDTPSVRDVLAWLGSFQEPIEIVHFHYDLVQYPQAGEKGDKLKPYQVKIDLEFTAESPAVAERFQEALEKAPTLVDKKQKVTWTAEKDSHKFSFVLRKT